MIKGCKVPDAELLREQYEINKNMITANVNAGKITDVLRHFISVQKDRMFFILEIPTNKKDEPDPRGNEPPLLHKDVYYIDGLDDGRAGLILDWYGSLLVNDGMSSFGFGAHDGSGEIMKNQYNVITLMSKKIGRYKGFFEEHGILRTDKLVTAWDTFSAEKPGVCSMIEENGMSVYDLPENLKGWRIYFAERRER